MAAEKKNAKVQKADKAEKKEKGGNNVLLTIIIVVLTAFIVGGGSFAGYFFLMQKNGALGMNKNANSQTVQNTVPDSTYGLGKFVVNLQDKNDKKFLEVNMYLGYDTDKKKKIDGELKDKAPMMRDAVIEILRSKSSTDFTQQGIDSLKKEVIGRINPLLTTGKIRDVYFNDILVQ